MYNKLRVLFLCLIGLQVFFPVQANAVPSFARQTGMDCAACHTSFPELTPFGREFKLNGYTLGERQWLPVAAMMQFSMTNVDKKSTAGQSYIQRQNDPQFDNMSIFIAGKITDWAGAFIQMTYDNISADGSNPPAITHHSHSDNTDIRIASNTDLLGKNLIFGLDLNNSPTVQDVWNSTPAWGYPFVGSKLTGVGGVGGNATPGSSTAIEGGFAQTTAGLGGYFFWDRHLYGELSFYGTADKIFRPLSLGNWYNNSNNTALDGRNNPYWRLAWNQDWGPHSLMVGTYGLRVDVFPDATNRTGPTDRFTDTALDAQYQYLSDPHIFTVQTTYIHERQSYNASQDTTCSAVFGSGLNAAPCNAKDSLNTFKAKASYLYDRKYGGTLAFFQTTGSNDAGLNNSNPSSTSPDTRGYLVELNYNPYTFARIGLQYTGWIKANGSKNNYDANGRNASDNDTLFLYTWFAF